MHGTKLCVKQKEKVNVISEKIIIPTSPNHIQHSIYGVCNFVSPPKRRKNCILNLKNKLVIFNAFYVGQRKKKKTLLVYN